MSMAIRHGLHLQKAGKLAVKYGDEVANVGGLTAKGAARACFVAGTLIHTKDGLKAIEEIQVGEHVWSHSEWDEGESSYRKVVNTFQFGEKEIWEVEVGTMDGRQETFRATGNHPFWVENDSEDDHWVAAELLKAGETLRLADGSAAHVITTRNTGEMEPVYNFEVEGFHTYHIGELGVWVHNDNCAAALKRSIDNHKEHLTPRDLDAARRELAGEIVKRKRNGVPFDHIDEVRNSQRGLQHIISSANNRLGNPKTSVAESARLQNIISEASKLLDNSYKYVPK